jgi:two-component system KDP operon response regulator KdpE
MIKSPLRPKIIIIDDERPILMTLEALLTRRGFDPQVANTASAGLALVRKTPPDLVLLDLGLPMPTGSRCSAS